jgi:sodium/potassium-transporting ATPase subunit alpha
MDTNVTNGNATGIVILTGSNSVMGRIAKVTTGLKAKPTLIQQEISRFIRIIVVLTVCLALLILLAWVGWLRIDHPRFLSVVAILKNVLGRLFTVAEGFGLDPEHMSSWWCFPKMEKLL